MAVIKQKCMGGTTYIGKQWETGWNLEQLAHKDLLLNETRQENV